MDRRRFLTTASFGALALAGAPMINLGRCRLEAAPSIEVSTGAVDLVRESTVIDMLGLLTLDWERLAATAEFKALIKAKTRFVVPATVFFIVYYFSLPLLVGYAPELMARKVFGVINIAYLFALSQFVMAWLVAWFYVRAAARFDRMARDVVETDGS